MKQSLFVVLVSMALPLMSRSQDCKLLRDTDPYTKETKVSTGFLTLQGASVTVDADSKEVDFFFTLPDKCFEDESTVFIFFEGTRSRTTYRNAGSMNCDGYFHFKFKNNPGTNTVLNKLGTMNVAQFVFTARDKKETVVSLLPDQQAAFKEAVSCLVKESKTLIK